MIPTARAATGDPEDGIDFFDDDGDGSAAIRRDFVNGMDASIEDAYNLSNGAVFAGTTVALSPTATDPAKMKLKQDFTWESGELHVVVSVLLADIGACELQVKSGSTTTTATLSLGVQDLTFTAVAPGDTVKKLDIVCAAGTGPFLLDWMTVQNGPYEWAPADDLAADFDTTALPGSGRMVVIRRSDVLPYLFTGSDVGGFAWSTDGLDWFTENGTDTEFNLGGQLGVYDIASENGSTVYALTGASRGGAGGLWETTNLGLNWTLVSGDVGGYKKSGDCHVDGLPDTATTTGAGKLLLHDYDADVLYIGSSDGDKRGIWVMDPVGDICQPFSDLDLPVGLPTVSGGLYDARPSALALSLRDGPDPLLVGYRALVDDIDGGGGVPAAADDPIRTALYVCEGLDSTFRCSAGVQHACEPVDDADGVADEVQDVRDIEPDPEKDNLFYVADGGYRWGAAGAQCAVVESTVHAMFLVDDGGAFGSPLI